ncbi:MAG TPA: helical backbone metal receptor [Thermoanaerobaculia bacterium]|nr:helical backbone metal receptor [Thermoanaerobaculia bacterium]
MRDVRGHPFDFTTPPQRVVSLVPSITETLFELGAGDTVVAITDFCIFPPDLTLPRVGGTKNPRVDEIRALIPDLVHMNLEENLRRHGDAIEAFAPVFVSEPKSVDDVEALILQLGEIHDRRVRASELVTSLREERVSLSRRAFTFACPIWKNPWMWCGGDTYVSRLVESAGGVNVLGDRLRYPQVALEDVLALRPDVTFLPDEPYLFTEQDAADIRGSRPIGPFSGHLFTWHGSRTIEGLRFLREALR